jgi:hypothetical protein
MASEVASTFAMPGAADSNPTRFMQSWILTINVWL